MSPEGRDVRPTTDRVRQAVFNSLASADRIHGASVADLFAGSGALGIEALSRGAADCVFVEHDKRALAVLRDNIRRLGLDDRATVITRDVLAYATNMAPVDLALVDPPYEFDGWHQLLGAVKASLVVAESDRTIEAEGWADVRTRRYGRTWVTFLEPVP
jgi:16S rRNA (guanine966-N2)-methyltransferase